MRWIMAIAAVAALGAAVPAAAQAHGRGNGGIPPGQRPPAGLCRVWIDGVPPGRQPRATDCSTAVRTVPSNGRVIWGDHTSSQGVYDPRHAGRIYTSGGDVLSNRSCTRQVVNGVVHTTCGAYHSGKHTKVTHEKRANDARDDRFEHSRDRR